MARALVTCDDENLASRRVIDANGGVADGTGPRPWRPSGVMLRFRVATS